MHRLSFGSFLMRFLTISCALCAGAFAWGVSRYRHRLYPLPDADVWRNAIFALHDAIAGRTPKPMNWRSLLPQHYPGVLTLQGYQRGQPVWRCEESASPLGNAIQKCIEQLLAHSPPKNLFWRLDLVRSVAKLPWFWGLHSFMLPAGVEGLQVTLDNGQVVSYLPDDLFRLGLLDRYTPLPFIPELKMGLDFKHLRAWVQETTLHQPVAWHRLAVWSMLLDASHPEGYRPVYRGHLASVEVNRNTMLNAAMAQGRYMVNALVRDSQREYPCTPTTCRSGRFRTEKGQFLYNYHLLTDQYDFQNRSIYNVVRHAGTAYALANLARLTKGKSFSQAAFEAIEYLVTLDTCRTETFACVTNDDEPDLGTAALALLAIAELRLATADPRFDIFAQKLATFLMFMQRPNGSFRHIYHLKTRTPDENEVMLFYSGEAAFALAKAYRAYHNRAYLEAADRALAHLTGPAVNALPFHFGFGEEHWTCQAAREVAPEVMNRHYFDFCLNFSRFIERQQFTKTDTMFPDFSGSYGFSPFIPPHTNGAGSRTEANVSILELAQLHHIEVPDVKRQIQRSVEHILMHHKRASSCWLCANPETADGAIVNSLSTWEVRIDTVQHTTTALIRAIQVLYP